MSGEDPYSSDFGSYMRDYLARAAQDLASRDSRAFYKPSGITDHTQMRFEFKTGEEVYAGAEPTYTGYARKALGITDPIENARAAYRLYSEAGYRQWMTYSHALDLWYRPAPVEPWSGPWWKALWQDMKDEWWAAWRKATRPALDDSFASRRAQVIHPFPVGQLEDAILGMEPDALAMLRRGPVGYGCTVCRAIREDYNLLADRAAFEEEYEGNDSLYRWHGHDSGSDEGRYLRCILVYVLAGWDPEPGWGEQDAEPRRGSGLREALGDMLGGLS